MTHGSCNFAPPKDLEHVKDLLERKRREREGMSGETQNGSGLTRSASVGSAPATDHHQHSITSPFTPTHTSSHNTSPSATPSPSDSSPSPPSARTSPPLQSIKSNDRLSPSAILTYSDLSNISEHDLREVEREAERRLRPYACSVGDCQRRLVEFDSQKK
jgi:transcription factor SFP1